MIGKDVKVSWDKEVPVSLEGLLPNTVYGTEGKLQYRHQDPLAKLRRLRNKRILSVHRKDKVVAVAVYLERDHHGQRVFYVRYVAFAALFKIKSLSLIKTPKLNPVKKNSIREHIFSLLQAKLGTDSQSKHIVYSYIEVDNLPSLQLSQSFGFEKIRTMQTLVFNRFFPKVKSHVSKIDELQKSLVLEQLRRRYGTYHFFVEEGLFDSGAYYVYDNGTGLSAGLKATVVHWDIVHLPGFEGFVIQNVLPWLPVLSQRFHKDQIRFIAFEAVWYAEGAQQAVFDLMETACADLGMYMGMIWCDTACPLGKMLLDSGQLGWLHKLNKSGHAYVMARFEGYEDVEKSTYMRSPVYISAYDVT